MPQIILEYSYLLETEVNFATALEDISHILVKHLPCELSSCKARAIKNNIYFMGDGSKAFVNLSIKVLEGRSPETLQKTGEEVFKLISDKFMNINSIDKVKISLEITELSRFYYKN